MEISVISPSELVFLNIGISDNLPPPSDKNTRRHLGNRRKSDRWGFFLQKSLLKCVFLVFSAINLCSGKYFCGQKWWILWRFPSKCCFYPQAHFKPKFPLKIFALRFLPNFLLLGSILGLLVQLSWSEDCLSTHLRLFRREDSVLQFVLKPTQKHLHAWENPPTLIFLQSE